MAVVRVEKTNNYVSMSKSHLREKGLSLKAKGLMSVVLGLPDDWEYSIKGLCSICKESETAIASAIKELKEYGYVDVIKRYPKQDERTKIEYEYVFYENPKQEGGNQGVENQPLENLGLENQGLDVLGLEKNANRINNKLNNKNNTPPTPPKGEQDEVFDKFWKAYPKKKAKADAEKAFKKISPTDYGLLMEQLEKQKRSFDWKKENGQYIPYPASWLNGQRWLDTVDESGGEFDDFI